MSVDEVGCCPACGAALGSDAPAGLCAKCVMEVMMDFAADDQTEIDVGSERVGGTAGDGNVGLGCVGDYQILERIAAGGMGVVYRARQRNLDRLVALKLIAEGKLASRNEKERFLLEARAAGELDHPNIVPIYEVGRDEGQYFFSMRLVTGGDVADLLRDLSLKDPTQSSSAGLSGFRERQTSFIKLLIKVARAVHYAHEQGILHRDLKPSNILIDHHGEPQISDFGLAKRVHDDTSLTLSGQVLGSPAYMAPEQAQGLNDSLTPAVDTYAIGVMLYQMLAGQLPFDAESPMALIQQMLTREPRAPRRINARIDRDLEIICLQCLEKAPSDRYATAHDLAEDLERWLDGRPILAKPASVTRRLMKWTRRQPAIAALVIVAGVGTLLMAGVTWRFGQSAARSANDAYLSGISLANEHVGRDKYPDAQEELARLVPDANQTDLRGFEWHWLWKLTQQPRPTVRQSDVTALVGDLNHPGRLLMHLSNGQVRTWNLQSDQSVAMETLNKPPPKDVVRFHGAGVFLLAMRGNGDFELALANGDKPMPRGRLPASLRPAQGAFLAVAPGKSPTSFVATPGKVGDDVTLWMPPWKQGRSALQLDKELLALAISPKSQNHNRYYVALCYRNVLELWQWETDVFVRTDVIQKMPGPVSAMTFSPNGRLVVTADPSGKVCVYNRLSKKLMLERQHRYGIGQMTCLTDEAGLHVVVFADQQGDVSVWNLNEDLGKDLGFDTLSGLQPPFGFSSDNSDIVAMYVLSEEPCVVRNVTGTNLKHLGPMPMTGEPVAMGLLDAASGTVAIVVQTDDKLELYHSKQSGELKHIGECIGGRGRLGTVAHAVGPYWSAVVEDTLYQWDLSTGRMLGSGSVAHLSEKVRIIAGQSAFLLGMKGWHVSFEGVNTGGRWRTSLMPGASPMAELAVTPDHRTLAIAQEDGDLRLVQRQTGQFLVSLANRSWSHLAFSPDGKALAGYESSGNLLVWRIPDAENPEKTSVQP